MKDNDETRANVTSKRAAAGRLGGQKGGRARADALTPTARSEIAREAAAARWKTVPMETHCGVLHIGEMAIECSVLNTKTRVLSQNGFWRAIGTGNIGHVRDGAFKTLPFLSAKNLQPFISERLTASAEIIVYRQAPREGMRGGGGFQVAHGIDATLIPEICDVWLKAREAGKLSPKQAHLAAKAELLMRGLARVGIIALVDEATGYQAERDKNELATLLKAYVVEEMQPWVDKFPLEFFRQVHRLWGWPMREGSPQGPRYVGKIINDYIYGRMLPGLPEKLAEVNPVINGRRRHKHYQHLTGDTGIPHLDKQIASVTTLMAVSDDRPMFEMLLKKRFPKRGDQMQLPTSPAPKDVEQA